MQRMRRRLILRGAAALVLPFARGASGEPGAKPLIGVLMSTALEADFQKALREGMRARRYEEGRDYVVEWRGADGRVDRANAIAAELVRLKADVIVAVLTPAARAAQRATTSTPIVMVSVGDPVATGLVASLSRPGGNVTGLSASSAELAGKRLGLLRQLIPELKDVGLLLNAADPFAKPFLAETLAAAASIGMRVHSADVRTPDEVDKGLAALQRAGAGAVIVQGLLTGSGWRAAERALNRGMPAASPQRQFVESGGLMSYGASREDLYRRAASYVVRILKGAKPGDLPVEQPTAFDLVLNLRAAKQLGLAVPPELRLRADELIE